MSGRVELWGTDDWRPLASCRDLDTNIFFPIGVTGVAVDQIAAAKDICHGCLVRGECLEFALATNQESGVWGGTSEEERRILRRARRQRQRAAVAQTA